MVKVVTGVRRCGKSTLLDMMRQHLAKSGIPERRLLSFKMESMEFDGIDDYRTLYTLVRARAEGVGHPYLFFDELQEVTGWERAINGLRVDLDCDIYLTGSNAFLLSSEISTLLSGRYVEIEMQPLVFAEYLDFRGMSWSESSGKADIAEAADGSIVTLESLFEEYRHYGGFPFLALSPPDQEEHRIYCRSLMETVIVRDILERDRRRGRRALRSPDLLRRICDFLADNVGNESSAHSISRALRAEGSSISSETVDAYMNALREAYLFYEVRRYDIKGKSLLKTNKKHYVVDPAIRTFLDSYRGTDQGRMLENIVYLQLRYDGFEVSVGKLRDGEIDFVAERAGERIYIQVTETMLDPATQERELRPLLAVKDAFPKMVVVRDGRYPKTIDGVRIVKLIDFLLKR